MTWLCVFLVLLSLSDVAFNFHFAVCFLFPKERFRLGLALTGNM